MSVVHFEWNPDPVVFGQAILTVEAALRDRTLPLMFAAEQTQADIRERFETETDPEGAPWQEWAESYVDYAESFPNIGILRQTGELYERASSNQAFIISNDSVFYDPGVLPARGIWHQEGRPGRTTASGSPNPLPKRAFLGLSAEAEARIMLTFVNWFDRAVDLYVTSRGRVGRRHALRGPGGRFIKAIR